MVCCVVLRCGMVWCSVVWCDVVMLYGVVWCCVWCDVVGCGVMWCYVVWCEVWLVIYQCCLSTNLLIWLIYQAYESALQLTENRDNYKPFCIPIVVIPATISNNVPGTECSLGADTALNVIVEVRLVYFAGVACESFFNGLTGSNQSKHTVNIH